MNGICTGKNTKGKVKSREINQDARKIGLIFKDYRDILRELRRRDSVQKDYLMGHLKRADVASALDFLVAEEILTEDQGVYRASEFARKYLDSPWGVDLDAKESFLSRHVS